jgi:Tfp pilus assembly PilM family ATPase
MKTDRHIPVSGGVVTAIEVGTEWIKLIQVDLRRQAAVVSHVAVQKLDEADTSAAGVARAIKALNLRVTDVIACVPRQAVTVRTFELPSADPREVSDMIDLQITKQTPYSRDEIVFDYRLSAGAREGYTRVMLVIAPSAVMRQRFRMLEDAGLNVRLITVSTDGLAGALQHGSAVARAGLGGGVALLDIDAANAELLVLQDGMVLSSRSLAVGARDLVGDPVAGSERLIQETARALETFRHESPSVRIDRLLLAGATAGQDGLADRLRSILGLPVEPFDALKGAPGAGTSATGADDRSRNVSLTAVAGAALAPGQLEIDLTPESILTRRAIARRAAEMTVTAILGMAVVTLLSLWVESRIFVRQHYRDRLMARVEATTPVADEVESMRRKVAIVGDRMRGALTPVVVLAELHALIGGDTSVTSIELEAARLRLRGASTGGPEASSKLVNALEASPVFREAKRTRTVSARDQTEFEITCELEVSQP